MDNLYLEVFNCTVDQIEVPLETLIIYFICDHCKTAAPNLILRDKLLNEPSVFINIKSYNIVPKNELSVLVTYCVFPLIINNNITVISGLCSVARQIVKNAPKYIKNEPDIRKLLGFREACLMACNESSVWTKFCEIDMISTIKHLLQSRDQFIHEDKIILPEDLTRFECHLSQPVRIHNVYKVAQDLAKLKNKNEINTNIPKDKLDLEHKYGEGPYMTLADVILFPLIHITFNIFGTTIFKNHIPRVFNWYNNMLNEIKLIDIKFSNLQLPENLIITQGNIKNQSLYVSDPERYKPRNRIFTKQPDIINALNTIQNLNLQIELCEKPFGNEINFDWTQIPLEANPEGGSLPKSRMKRKCEQLENLAKSVIKIAKPGHTIIDFCSGSGHLGILLAVKLPKCKIILLENKEMSLNRAKDRVQKLKLQNIILLQCNLDYFVGNFDIGVSLHACGVATDLVLRHCLQRNAAFVSCPCCYGGVHVCHHISYPRSKVFRDSELTLKDYLVLGHSADQTHDSENAKTKQGIECMNIIDTDRKLQAEELGYEVMLAKMVPESCTPKNNILVGLPRDFL